MAKAVRIPKVKTKTHKTIEKYQEKLTYDNRKKFTKAEAAGQMLDERAEQIENELIKQTETVTI